MTELNQYDLALILSTLNADLKSRRDTIETMINQAIEPSISLIEQLDTVMELVDKTRTVLEEVSREPQVYNNEGAIFDGISIPYKAPVLDILKDGRKASAVRINNAVSEILHANRNADHIFDIDTNHVGSTRCKLCGHPADLPGHLRATSAATLILLKKAMRTPERD